MQLTELKNKKQFSVHRLDKDGCSQVLLLVKGEDETYAQAWISKPYPNEHACRLRQPTEADKDGKWARMERDHNGKKYSVIMMPVDGKQAEQAYRYPKDKWSEADARKHCEAHKGVSFEAAIKKASSEPLQLLNGLTRTEPKLGIWMKTEGDDGNGGTLSTLSSGFLEEQAGTMLLVNEEIVLKEVEGELVVTDNRIPVELTIKSISEPEYIIGGIVYPSNKVDAHDETMEPNEVWKLMKHFMLNGRTFSIEHGGRQVDLPILESFFTESETVKNGKPVPPGSFWLALYAGDYKDVWEAAKKGEIGGFSMEGWGKKVKDDN